MSRVLVEFAGFYVTGHFDNEFPDVYRLASEDANDILLRKTHRYGGLIAGGFDCLIQ